MLVNIYKLEDAINKCSKETSTKNSLSADASALSEIYGLMIHERKIEIAFSDYLVREVVTNEHLAALDKYYDLES
jgi:hypothetical protein